jgi:carbon-monoxide dehydrogenase medium subunit
VVGVAISLALENGICTRARIALGAVAPFVIRVRSVEEMLEGNALDPELIEAAARAAAQQSSPIDDVRASGKYRKQQVFVLVRRLVFQAWQNLSEGDRNP